MRDIFSIETENILGQKKEKAEMRKYTCSRGKGKKEGKPPCSAQKDRPVRFRRWWTSLKRKERKEKKRKEKKEKENKQTCSAKKESTLSISAIMDFLNSRSFVSGAPYL